MFRQIFDNMPPVVKNLLIINVLFFLAKFVLDQQGLYIGERSAVDMMAVHYPSSEYFRPYQIATHFFMHADIMHILFNMFALVVFGSHLERYWGPKRFLTFYLVTAIGAAFLHMFIQGIEVYSVTGEVFPQVDFTVTPAGGGMVNVSATPGKYIDVFDQYYRGAVGASGAIYGLIMAFAMLFPNTQFQLLFPPIPIKAKWLAVGLGAFALYQGMSNTAGDSVAHFAHLGGMLFGFIMIKIWNQKSNNFY